MDFVIFSIDEGHDLHTKAKFLRHMDTLRSMKKLKGNLKLAISSFQGNLEDSYIISMTDFNDHVRNSEYVQRQAFFLNVGGSAGMPYVLVDKFDNIAIKGNLVSTRSLPEGCIDWTYRPDMGFYWVSSEEMK